MDLLVAFLLGLSPCIALLLWQRRDPERRSGGSAVLEVDGSQAGQDAPDGNSPTSDPVQMAICVGPVSDPVVDGPATCHADPVVAQPQAGRFTRSIQQPPVEADEAEAVSLSAERMLASAGVEMLESVGAIESRAHLLMDSIGDAAAMPARAEGLWLAMRRARSLCRKLQCYTGQNRSRPRIRATALAPMIERLRHDFAKDTDDALRVSLRVAATLPLALCDEEMLYDALRFAIDALLALEPDAETLSVALQNTFNEDSGPLVIVELQIALNGDGSASHHVRERLELGYAAALNLVKAQGAFLSFSQQPGAGATILISLPATTAGPREEDALEPLEPTPSFQDPVQHLAATDLEPEIPIGLPAHAFGGVLVLEDQPAVRSLISNEVRAMQRNVFACPTGPAASSLIQATPERFELWIAEIEGQDSSRHRLALETLQLHPDLKLLSLTNGMEEPLTWPDALRGRVAELSKPFGVGELRDQMRRMLG